jgi:Protein of unknown function (DUF2490)
MKYLLGTAAMLAFTPFAARAATADDFQVWSSLQASGSISGNIVGSVELSGRFVDDSSRLGVAIVRPTIGYKFSHAVTAYIGYAHQTTLNPNRRDTQENRIFQQINWTMGKVGNGTFSSRTRLEERFVNTGNDTGLRFRFQLKYTVPLKAKGTNFLVSSEPLIALNTTDWGQHAGLDQWRNFIGVNFPVAKKLTLETGFQHRYQKRFNQPDRSDFIVPLTLAYKF